MHGSWIDCAAATPDLAWGRGRVRVSLWTGLQKISKTAKPANLMDEARRRGRAVTMKEGAGEPWDGRATIIERGDDRCLAGILVLGDASGLGESRGQKK